MANVPYTFGAGTPPQEVEPTTIEARQNIQATPEAFGAAKGRALEQVGQTIQHVGNEALNVSNIYGHVAADDGANKFQDHLDKLQYGDPNTIGPDGQPDTGLFGKRGADAMTAYKDVHASAKQAMQDIRDSLPTPQAQMQFDSASRHMYSNFLAKTGTHYEQEGKVWAGEVNQGIVSGALTSIARDADNDEAFNNHLGDIKGAMYRSARLKGAKPGDPQINTALDHADAIAWKTRAEIIGANEPKRALDMVNEHRDELSVVNPNTGRSYYDSLAEGLNSRAKEQRAIGNSDKHIALAKQELQQTQVAQGGQTGAAALIKGREGLIFTPKWDQNHVRVGYGSDTITHPDGSYEEVKPGMTITREDAERDLNRRVGLSQKDVQQHIGAQAWSSLPQGARDALTSVSYNYGSLSKTPGLVAAAKSGDAAAVSQAILGLKGQNGGINDRRREIEASVATGGTIPASYGTGAARTSGGGSTAPHLDTSNAPAGSPSMQSQGGAQPAIFTDFPATPPPPSPPQPSPEQTLAATYRSIDADPDIAPEDKDAAKRKAHEKLAMDAVEEEQTAKARRTAADEASQQIFTMMTSENGMDRAKAANILANNLDPRLATPEAFSRRKELWAMLNKPDKEDIGRVYGEGYSKAYDDLFSGKITNQGQIYQQAAPGGPLTNAGADRLIKIWKDTKDADKQASHATFSGIMNQLEEDFGADQKSEDKYAKRDYHYNIFPMMEAAFSKVMANGQKSDVDKFLRELPDNARKMNDSLRSPEKRALQRMDDLIEQARVNTETTAIAAESTMPKDPEFTRTGVKQENWTQAMALPRPGNMPANEWAIRLHDFALAPTAGNAANFDNVYRRPGAGKSILDTLGIPMVDGPASTIKKPAAETAYPPPPAPANYFEKGKPAPVGRSIKQFEESLANPGEAKIAGEQ